MIRKNYTAYNEERRDPKGFRDTNEWVKPPPGVAATSEAA